MLNNPAGRLHALLSKAIEVQQGGRARDAWSKVLGLEGNDISVLLERLGPVYALPNETKLAVLRLSNLDHKRWLTWVPAVEQAFAQTSLNGDWNNFRETIRKDNSILQTLWQLDDQLSRQAPEPEVSSNDLVDIARKVQELREEVMNEDISSEVKEFLLRHLREIQDAIENYAVEGGLGFSRAVINTVGSVIFAPHETPKEREFLRNFRDRVSNFALVLQIAANAAVLTDITVRMAHWLNAAPTTVVEGPAQPHTKFLNGEVMPEQPDPEGDSPPRPRVKSK